MHTTRHLMLSAAMLCFAPALGFTLLVFASSPASAQSNDKGAAGAANNNNAATANRDDRRENRGDRDDDRDWAGSACSG